MGLVLGGLLLAKLYTPPEFLLALLLMLVLRRERRRWLSDSRAGIGNRCWRRWASRC